MVNLKQLAKNVRKIASDNLVSMMVFGSYARGDHNPNSDVDLIVVVKEKTDELIDRLARLEYEISIRTKKWVDHQASKFLNAIGFKKNIFLFDEVEFKKKKFNFCDSKFLAKLLIPKGIIWSAIKRDGKVVCGKNLLNFKPKISFWDKIKAPLPGIGACFIAAFLVLFAKDKAIQLAQTGLRWTYMNVTGVLRRSDITSIFGNFVQILKVALGRAYPV